MFCIVNNSEVQPCFTDDSETETQKGSLLLTSEETDSHGINQLFLFNYNATKEFNILQILSYQSVKHQLVLLLNQVLVVLILDDLLRML